jgi:hypothetical protein
MRMSRALAAGLLGVVLLAGCAARTDPAASSRAGYEVTGGHWHSVTQICEKD